MDGIEPLKAVPDERSSKLSPLTKILIVLLSLFSIFLCGAIVTYVGSANNYKALADDRQATINAIENEVVLARRLLNESEAKMQALEKELRGTIANLTDQNQQLAVQYRNAQREILAYQQTSESWKGLVANFQNTIAQMEQSRELTRDQLDSIREEMIRERKELNEITAMLYERTIQMQSLEADRRRYLEQKTALEEQLEKAAQGTVPVGQVEPVTQPVGQAVMAMGGPADETGLKGMISDVGASLVTITLGSADGVREGMVFHITRGADFLADIVITDVDVNKAAGVLELVQERPRIGDLVSTSL